MPLKAWCRSTCVIVAHRSSHACHPPHTLAATVNGKADAEALHESIAHCARLDDVKQLAARIAAAEATAQQVATQAAVAPKNEPDSTQFTALQTQIATVKQQVPHASSAALLS